jgi:hypothetical protein
VKRSDLEEILKPFYQRASESEVLIISHFLFLFLFLNFTVFSFFFSFSIWFITRFLSRVSVTLGVCGFLLPALCVCIYICMYVSVSISIILYSIPIGLVDNSYNALCQ